jgi:phosphoribosylformylglycinamidine cyclo-ligase
MATKAVTYKAAGVDIRAGDRLVEFIRGKIPAIGGFSGSFPLALSRYKHPLLAAAADGVGTKLLLASRLKNHRTVGIDCVAMVVNDLVVCGAQPLFFLDYYATGRLTFTQARQVLEGIVAGCREAGCQLLGGETAELPGLYQRSHYDLAGFGVGIVEKKRLIDGRTIRPGDILIGIASNGLHSNGYSLVRKVLKQHRLSLGRRMPELGEALGTALLRPTRIYVKLILGLLDRFAIQGMAHITGGGIPGNLVRILPRTTDAVVETSSWQVPEIFCLIQRRGPVEPHEMFRTFNMGIGMILVVRRQHAERLARTCRRRGHQAFSIGRIVHGSGRVLLKGL